MEKGEGTFPAARVCDCCVSAAALVFCRADNAFMCVSCDAKLHSSSERHGRVWVCEVCEQAPAVVTCKADAAVLCFACDRDIHTANPLARKHNRSPVLPFYDTAESVILRSGDMGRSDYLQDSGAWDAIDGLTTSDKVSADGPNVKLVEFLFSDSDGLLDFDGIGQMFGDSVVPVQTIDQPPVPADSSENRFQIDFTRSNINSYSNSYSTPSVNLSVSSSSIDVGVVPDGGAASDATYPFGISIASAVDFNGNQGLPTPGMSRKARVLRYREKRKNRKFQKTIRYASRKAYAETRPRIKGRFAKRIGGDSDLDPQFPPGSPDFISDSNYAVLMSF